MGYQYVAVVHKIPAGPHINHLLLDDTGSELLELYLDDLALLDT